MRILQINHEFGVLSTGQATKELASGLCRNHYKCNIAYSVGKVKLPGTYKIGNYFDYKLHALCSRIIGLQGYFSTISTLELIQYMKKIKPDVVHLRNLYGDYINLKILLKYLAKNDIPTVITLHDSWFYTGRCTNYLENHCYQWQTCCYNCSNNKNSTTNWFFDRSKKMYLDKEKYFSKIKNLAVIGGSVWITNEAKKSFLSKAKIIQTIFDWVDTNTFKPLLTTDLKRKINPRNKFVILGISSVWEKHKGLNDFINLAKLIAEDCIILLIGNMPDKRKLPSNILSIPRQDSVMALARLYNVSDVFVCTSNEETFGKPIIEALACGTPVIVYNQAACSEFIGDGCGYLTMQNSVKEILKGIHIIKGNTKSYYTKNCRNLL